MKQETYRNISKRAKMSHVTDLLQSIFLAEILKPSNDLWIISPWISDIPVIDNRGNQFTHLHPFWESTRLKLSTVLCQLMKKGTRVYLITRPDIHNNSFIDSIKMQWEKQDKSLIIKKAHDLHEKGILGDDYYLSGSMNLTFYGITINDEYLHFSIDQAIIAQKKIGVNERWGRE